MEWRGNETWEVDERVADNKEGREKGIGRGGATRDRKGKGRGGEGRRTGKRSTT